jgi:hypothetical protein
VFCLSFCSNTKKLPQTEEQKLKQNTKNLPQTEEQKLKLKTKKLPQTEEQKLKQNKVFALLFVGASLS